MCLVDLTSRQNGITDRTNFILREGGKRGRDPENLKKRMFSRISKRRKRKNRMRKRKNSNMINRTKRMNSNSKRSHRIKAKMSQKNKLKMNFQPRHSHKRG